MQSFLVRTRKVNPTDYQGSRIRVERISASGERFGVRTMAYDYSADNPHVGAMTEYLDRLGVAPFRAEWVRETRSGRGNVYRVSGTE